MSEKRTCPACQSHTSAVLRAYLEGTPCPYCALPAGAAEAVEKAREHHVAEETVARLIEAEKRVAAVEHENTQLRWKLAQIGDVLERKITTLGEEVDQ